MIGSDGRRTLWDPFSPWFTADELAWLSLPGYGSNADAIRRIFHNDGMDRPAFEGSTWVRAGRGKAFHVCILSPHARWRAIWCRRMGIRRVDMSEVPFAWAFGLPPGWVVCMHENANDNPVRSC